MRFIDSSLSEKRRHIAQLLQIDLYTPEDWPEDGINRILEAAERAANEAMIREVVKIAGEPANVQAAE